MSRRTNAIGCLFLMLQKPYDGSHPLLCIHTMRGGIMKPTSKSIERIIEEQVQRWQMTLVEKKEAKTDLRVVTISREPGSGGRIVAQKLAQSTGFDLFHQEVINEMAQSARVNARILETLDEKGLSTLDNWISSLVDDRHLWPDKYLQHLMKVINTIGRHGGAVIVGRGANFILPPEKRLRVRVIAPLPVRIQNVAREFDVSIDDARRRVIRTESDRKSFVRKYFYTDIADHNNYDLIINTESVPIDSAVNCIKCCLDN